MNEANAGSYVLFRRWEWISQILANGDTGPWRVLFAGEHQAQPPLGKVGVGDTVYPISVQKGVLYVLGRMTITQVVPAEAWVTQTTGVTLDTSRWMWDTWWAAHKKTVTHLFPVTCVDAAALGEGTTIGLWAVPADVAAGLRLGSVGKEQPLKVTDGQVSSAGLAGHYRRLHPASAAALDEVLA